MSDRIAVTVIGGYLGAGKTTLVNHILSEATERIVVLVNDFGDINIDADLIRSRSGDTLELANGCICCSLVDGFSSALDRIVAFEPRPDRLVIEASGVSDPAQVAAYGHGPGLVLDAVIVLADAETVRDRCRDRYVGQTVSQQLAAAHVIVLNKADLVPESELADTAVWLGESFPEAFVMAASHGRVPAEVLFGREAGAGATEQARRSDHRDHHDDHDDHDDHDHRELAHAFRTWTIEQDTPTTRAAIETMMTELPDDVVRAKGFVWLEESPERPAVLQRVGRRWTLRQMGEWRRDPATRIVVIAAETR